MTTRGRPPKEKTAREAENRRVAGRRLATWRKGRGLTQEDLAERLGRSILTVGRYERGEQSVPDSTAQWLEQETGIFWRYWTGETAAQTPQGYEAELDEQTEVALDEAAREIQKDRETRIARLESLFFLCGYRYTDNDIEAAFYDLMQDEDPQTPPPGEHKLTPYSDPDEAYTFTEEELNTLLREFDYLIGYHWHKKVMSHRRAHRE